MFYSSRWRRRERRWDGSEPNGSLLLSLRGTGPVRGGGGGVGAGGGEGGGGWGKKS